MEGLDELILIARGFKAHRLRLIQWTIIGQLTQVMNECVMRHFLNLVFQTVWSRKKGLGEICNEIKLDYSKKKRERELVTPKLIKSFFFQLYILKYHSGCLSSIILINVAKWDDSLSQYKCVRS